VHVVARSQRRGAEVVAEELASALDLLGHDNDVVAVARSTSGQSVPHLPPLVASSRLGAVTYLRSAWRLRRMLASCPADVVLAHGGSAALVTALAVPRGTVRVWQRILGFPPWKPLQRQLWQAVSSRFDGMVVLTDEMEDEVRALGFRRPVWHVPNARDPERFMSIDRPTASAELREVLGVGPDVSVLGFVGHLVPQKQAELAVEVLADLRHRGIDAHLVIAGDGPDRPAVEARAVTCGVEGSVTLLGHRDDPELVFGGADVALITSRSEGIPGVAIEAQMAGCPVVTFLVGGVEDVVEDHVTGLIVPWPEPLLMAKMVAGLLEDRGRLGAMSEAAIARADTFSVARSGAMYAEVLDVLYRTAGATAPAGGIAGDRLEPTTTVP
jgi:glycosyltransferase involved in cell wall biosynthesis